MTKTFAFCCAQQHAIKALQMETSASARRIYDKRGGADKNYVQHRRALFPSNLLQTVTSSSAVAERPRGALCPSV